MRDWTTWMLQRQLRNEAGDGDGGGGDPPKTFTQAEVDAKIAAATGALQKDLKTLADKVKGHEDAKLAAEGKTQELLDKARLEIEDLTGKVTSLSAIAEQHRASQAQRWEGIAAELGKTEKGKGALKNVFAAGKTPEDIDANLATYARLEASGLIGELKSKSSIAKDDKGGGGRDDTTMTPRQQVAKGYEEQASGR